MLLVACILIGAIITLDQRAMKRGQIGIWETITGVRPARTASDVETAVEIVTGALGIGRDAIRQIGYTTIKARDNERLRHIVYYIDDETQFKALTSKFEDRLKKQGVRTHNRHLIKQPREMILSFYVGTYGTRTHKYDFHYFIQGTPTPAPIPDQWDRSNHSGTTDDAPQNPSATAPANPVQSGAASGDPRIALIFDDFGGNLDIARRFLDELDVPVTLAVIPYQNHSAEIVEMTRNAGQTAFLHMPMEPLEPSAMGTQSDIFLTTAMDDDTLRSRTRKMLSDYRGVQGVNNHTGSRLTMDRHRMRIVLREIQKAGLYFIDSRTIADTVAEDVARELGLPVASRNIFLDQGYHGGDVSENLQRLADEARKHGTAIGIGHAIDSTLDQLKDALMDIQADGIEIVPVKTLVH